MSLIVVGVDGSPGSIRALRHAVSEAVAHDATIRAVNVWHMPPVAYPPENIVDDLRDGAHATLGAALAQVDVPSSVTIQPVVLEGEPGHMLVAESHRALQLIVGSHGRGAVGELILGSVSNYCCRHAGCPVTVIPPRARV